MTSCNTIAQLQARLQSLGLDRLDAQLLLLHVLGKPEHQRGWLLAHDADPVPADTAATLLGLAQRRLAGEPLAYLTGYKSFYGLALQVDAAVLVPRSDTEGLVDWTLQLLPAAATGPLLDLGTGSGAVALALKSSRPQASVWASDLSPAALALASRNAQALGVTVRFCQGSWWSALPDDAPRFTCIVSNPPYIAEHDPHLTALHFEPASALVSGPDGLDAIRHLVAHAPDYLLQSGWLLLEHGFDQAAQVRQLLAQRGFASVQSRRDLAGLERCSGGQWTR